MKRVSAVTLDPTNFPTGATLKTDAILGRLNITTTLGDTDGDGDYDALYSLGSRSFSVWNAATGSQVFDSKNELDIKAKELAIYDDGRSDNKGVEPEAIEIGQIQGRNIVFVGLMGAGKTTVGKRLAKRDDARAIAKYRAEGASPQDIRRMVGL